MTRRLLRARFARYLKENCVEVKLTIDAQPDLTQTYKRRNIYRESHLQEPDMYGTIDRGSVSCFPTTAPPWQEPSMPPFRETGRRSRWWKKDPPGALAAKKILLLIVVSSDNCHGGISFMLYEVMQCSLPVDYVSR